MRALLPHARAVRAYLLPAVSIASLVVLLLAAASTGQAAPAVAQTTCPNNQVASTGISGITSCATSPAFNITCPDGSSIPLGGTCPLSTCPSGVQVLNGQACPAPSFSSTVVCPDGSIVVLPAACSPPSAPTGVTTIAGATVTYPAGWNLVAGPAGTILSGAFALYTLPPGATSYQVLPAGSPLQAGAGYWAYFPTATASTLAPASTSSITLFLAAGQYALIGNPSDTTATVSGAGLVMYSYDSSTASYTQSSQLAPGQGAWAFSSTGGPLTITTGASGSLQPPVPPPPPPPPVP